MAGAPRGEEEFVRAVQWVWARFILNPGYDEKAGDLQIILVTMVTSLMGLLFGFPLLLVLLAPLIVLLGAWWHFWKHILSVMVS